MDFGILRGRSLFGVNRVPGRTSARRVRQVEDCRRVGMLEDSLCQPLGRCGGEELWPASKPPAGSVPRAALTSATRAVLAPHIEEGSPDPALAEATSPALNSSQPSEAAASFRRDPGAGRSIRCGRWLPRCAVMCPQLWRPLGQCARRGATACRGGRPPGEESLSPFASLRGHCGCHALTSSRWRIQDSGHGEKIHAAGEGRGHPHSGRAGLYRCRSTACWVSSRVVKANRGHRFSPPSSQRCSHMRLYIQHPGRAKTVARQQTRLTGPPPMSGVLVSPDTGRRSRPNNCQRPNSVWRNVSYVDRQMTQPGAA
jgi:hypothetical protein